MNVGYVKIIQILEMCRGDCAAFICHFGEPAGIGPDICLSLAKRVDERPVVVLADRNLLQQRAQKLGLDIKFLEYSGQAESSLQGELYIEHVPRNYSR